MTEPLAPDDEESAFELAAAESVVAELEDGVAAALAHILAAWSAGKVGQALADLILSALELIVWEPLNPLLRAVSRDAVRFGMDRAAQELAGAARRAAARAKPPDLELTDLDGDTRTRVKEAARLARVLPLKTKRDLDAVMGRVSKVRSRAEGAARWTANQGLNAGTAAAAKATNQRIIWVPERDACLHCLAYAGWAIKPGDLFPADLTYGDKPLSTPDLPWPPLHPGCRCRARVYSGPPGPPPDDRSLPNPAARVAAEARRTVVYGWTSYASNPATLRAMSRLLRQGAHLAPSVERRAATLLAKRATQPRPRS